MLPVECFTRVGFSSRRNVAVPHNPVTRDAGPGAHQQLGQSSELCVLRSGKRHVVSAFQLYTDREVITRRSSVKGRVTGMPRSCLERDILSDVSGSADQDVSRHAQLRDVLEVGMTLGREGIVEQVIYPWTTKLTGRQTDGMDYDEIDDTGWWSVVTVG